MKKKVIATDIDEVLFPFLVEFVQWHNYQYGTTFRLDDFSSYEIYQTLNVPIPETVHRIHTFLRQPHQHLDVRPLDQAQEAIAKLGEHYQLAAITARHPEFESPTKAYLLRYFQQITDLTLVGHRETMAVLRTKSEICQEIKAMALIDDNFDHLKGCTDVGVKGVLFGNYPWNRQVHGNLGDVVHCRNWREVLEHFDVS